MQTKRALSVIGCLTVLFSMSVMGLWAQQLPADTTSRQPTPAADTSALSDAAKHAVLLDGMHPSLKSSILVAHGPGVPSYLDYRLQSRRTEAPEPLLVSGEYFSKSIYTRDEALPKQARPRWVLYTVFVLFLFVALIRVVFPTEFKIIIEAYYRERLLLQVSKEDNLATSWPYICLYAVFSFALGLFLVVAFSEFGNASLLTPLTFLKASLTIALLFILKIMISRFLSFVFELEKIMREYIAVIYLMYFNGMLVLLPFLLFIVLIPVAYFKILLIIFAISICILFIYRILRTSLHLFGDTQFSISYLILYLCTLEIAPILLLIRTLSN